MPSEKKKHLSGNLDQMALSLSGGGVRAVGFHLGTMSMLRRLGLLDNVQILSSVSGGSMLGIGYSLTQHLGREFQELFDNFYAFLPEVNILEQLLKRMTDREPPAPSGKRDMITAMANVYDEHFFQPFYGKHVGGRPLTFDILMEQPGKGHLKEMIFNATEFKTGTAFRFQVSESRCLIGNGNIAICKEHAGQIRIADIMAASSCIPVGMEPLFFPDDFRWPDDPKTGKRKKSSVKSTNQEVRDALVKYTDTKQPTIALMDGGVYDNQGITSTLLALNRRKDGSKEPDTHKCGESMSQYGRGEPPGPEDWAKWMSGRVADGKPHQHVGVKPEDLDLLIISDTPVRKASFFPRMLFSSEGKPKTASTPESKGIRAKFKAAMSWAGGRVTVGHISVFLWFLLIILGSSGIITLVEWLVIFKPNWGEFEAFRGTLTFLHITLPFLVLLLLGVGIAMFKRSKRKAVKELKKTIENWDKEPDKYINKLRIVDLMHMGILRAGSTAALTSAIYMDRIRGLGYATAFSRPDLRDKILTNEIFALQHTHNPHDSFHTMLKSKGVWPPPEELKRIVGVAATMPTKLWIDQDEDDPLSDLDYLVVCGQATICYNLMKFMWEELREEDGSWIDPKMSMVLDNMLTEWETLVDDPLSLLEDRKRNSALPKLRQHATELKEMREHAAELKKVSA